MSKNDTFDEYMLGSLVMKYSISNYDPHPSEAGITLLDSYYSAGYYATAIICILLSLPILYFKITHPEAPTNSIGLLLLILGFGYGTWWFCNLVYCTVGSCIFFKVAPHWLCRYTALRCL